MSDRNGTHSAMPSFAHFVEKIRRHPGWTVATLLSISLAIPASIVTLFGGDAMETAVLVLSILFFALNAYVLWMLWEDRRKRRRRWDNLEDEIRQHQLREAELEQGLDGAQEKLRQAQETLSAEQKAGETLKAELTDREQRLAELRELRGEYRSYQTQVTLERLNTSREAALGRSVEIFYHAEKDEDFCHALRKRFQAAGWMSKDVEQLSRKPERHPTNPIQILSRSPGLYGVKEALAHSIDFGMHECNNHKVEKGKVLITVHPLPDIPTAGG